MEPYIILSTGKKFNYFEFTKDRVFEDGVNIEMIAKSLSKLCRFTGHCEDFYSVAQHSVLCSELLIYYFNRPDLAIYGLLHDAAESMIGDINSPLKEQLYYFNESGQHYQNVRNLEYLILDEIAEKFNLNPETLRMKGENGKIVKQSDSLMASIEAEQLMPDTFPIGEIPYNVDIIPWDHNTARIEFLNTFHKLTV